MLSRVATGVFGVAFMWLFVDVLAFNGYLMKAISSVVILVLNYVFSKLITFRKKKAEGAETAETANMESADI